MAERDTSIERIVVYVLLAVIIGYLLFTRFAEDGNQSWACNDLGCSSFMTPDEWVNQFCRLDADNNVVCTVDVNGQQALVPLSQLDLSQLQVCKEYVCVQEIKVRAANYSIDIAQ